MRRLEAPLIRERRRRAWRLLWAAAWALAANASAAGGFEPPALTAPPVEVSPEPGASAAPPPPSAVPNPAARLPSGAAGAEYWDLLAQFETGHTLFARFLLTNLGPGEHNAVVLGHVIDPDGERTRFRNGRRRARWELSEDRLALDVNKCHLDLRDGTARLLVDKKAIQLDPKFAQAYAFVLSLGIFLIDLSE